MTGHMYDQTPTKGQYQGLQAVWEYYPIKGISAIIYIEGARIFNNRNAAYGISGALNTTTTNPVGLLTTDGTTPNYGGTSNSIATGFRYIF
jgi:hypothetical protein